VVLIDLDFLISGGSNDLSDLENVVGEESHVKIVAAFG
jgi:hypothetical protein